MNKKLAEKYQYIVWWGKSIGSFDYYIEAQLKRAEETNAPLTAIYEKTTGSQRTGEWATIEEIANPSTRTELIRWCHRNDKPIPIFRVESK